MRKVIVVAVREYNAAVKTKAFLIGVILMPIIMGGSILIQLLMKDKVDIREKKVAVLDRSGLVYEAIEKAADERNKTEIFEGEADQRNQVRPRFVFEQVSDVPEDPMKAAFDLSERVRRNEFFAFVLLPSDILKTGEDPARSAVGYYSNSPTYDDIEDWLRKPINDRVTELRFKELNINPEVVQRATEKVEVASLSLVAKDAEGRMVPAERTNERANILMPVGMMMMMFMLIMFGAQPLVQSVMEEKMQRIAEVLLGSIPPFQLMLGKLLGMVGVSLTLLTLYLVGGYIAIHRAGYAQFFPTHVIWWFVLFQVLAILLYGSVFAAIGAACTEMREAQNFITPVMLVVVAPMFVWFNVIKEPLSPLSTMLSLIPPATPMLMILRQAVPPGVPTWQPMLGVILVILTTLVCVWASGRIFRIGILLQGKPPKLGEMIRWVVRG